jgi:hypothetical protein
VSRPALDRLALDLYRSIVGERLRAASCGGCGGSLVNAAVERAEGAVALDEYQLSAPGQARLLAETVHLVLRCPGCGSEAHVGAPPRPWPPPVPQPPSPAPWPAAALEVYRVGIAERLSAACCGGCGAALADSELMAAVGGTSLDDYPLSDESLARLLAATQHLSVRCRDCHEVSEVLCETR